MRMGDHRKRETLPWFLTAGEEISLERGRDETMVKLLVLGGAPIPCDDAAIFPSDRAQRYTAGPAYRGTIRGGGHATLRPNGGRSSGLEAGEVERRRRPAVASLAFARWFVRRRPLRLPGAVFGSIVRSQLQDKMSGELQPRKRPKLRHHPAPVLGDSANGAARAPALYQTF